MQIDIQARDFSLTEALRNHAERRIRFALTRCDEHIQRVVMRMSDINGPRGGSDKRCHLQVVLVGLPDVVVVRGGQKMYQNRQYKNVAPKKASPTEGVLPHFDLGLNLILHTKAFALDEDSFGMM